MTVNLSTTKVPNSTFRLLVASPYYEIKGYAPYIKSWTETVTALNMMGIEWAYRDLTGDSYVDRAKNELMREFMKSEFTHVLMLDSDLSWSVEGFLKVIKCGIEGAEIVGASYPNKNSWESYGVVPMLVDGKPVIKELGTIKVMQVQLLPGGFILYSRKAIERTEPNLNKYYNPRKSEEFYEYFKHGISQSPYSGPTDNYKSHIRKAFELALQDFGQYQGPNPDDMMLECFRCNIERNGSWIGEDYYFQTRFREMGGTIWCVPDVEMGHYGVKEWRGNYWNYLQQMEQPPAKIEVIPEVKVETSKPLIYVNSLFDTIPDLSPYFEVTTQLTADNANSVKAGIFWNDELPDHRAIIQVMRQAGVPTFTMCHGGICASDSLYDDDLGNKEDFKTVSDYYLVWADRMKKYVTDKGHNPAKIFTVGAPVFRQVKHESDNKTVVYFPSHRGTDRDESLKTWGKIRAIPDINPVIKLIAHEQDVNAFEGDKIVGNRLNPALPQDNLEKIYEALTNAFCLVTDVAGTEIVIACYLDIPILKIKNQHPNRFPNVIMEVDETELEAWVKVMNLADFNREGRKNFVAQYDKGDCARNIAEVINAVIGESLPQEELSDAAC